MVSPEISPTRIDKLATELSIDLTLSSERTAVDLITYLNERLQRGFIADDMENIANAIVTLSMRFAQMNTASFCLGKNASDLVIYDAIEEHEADDVFVYDVCRLLAVHFRFDRLEIADTLEKIFRSWITGKIAYTEDATYALVISYYLISSDGEQPFSIDSIVRQPACQEFVLSCLEKVHYQDLDLLLLMEFDETFYRDDHESEWHFVTTLSKNASACLERIISRSECPALGPIFILRLLDNPYIKRATIELALSSVDDIELPVL